MPPRKSKSVPEKPAQELPIVFFLECHHDEEQEAVVPVGEVTSYSEILNAVEVSRVGERFTTDLMKSILEKVR